MAVYFLLKCKLAINWLVKKITRCQLSFLGTDKENKFLKIQCFLNWWLFPLFSWPLYLVEGCYCEEKLFVTEFKASISPAPRQFWGHMNFSRPCVSFKYLSPGQTPPPRQGINSPLSIANSQCLWVAQGGVGMLKLWIDWHIRSQSLFVVNSLFAGYMVNRLLRLLFISRNVFIDSNLKEVTQNE